MSTPHQRAYVLSRDEGQATWFAGALMLRKAGGPETGGRFALLDQRVPGGYAPPRHVHHHEDEAWYILDGEVTFMCGDQTLAAGPGAWVFLPRAVPHTFRVGPSGARLLTLSAPASFADFVEAAGEPALALTVPPPAAPDAERLAAIAARFGIDILGPPPAATLSTPEDAP
jgi:mannose-6-phosphate isomerase-like protein (cupin superfamily)